MAALEARHSPAAETAAASAFEAPRGAFAQLVAGLAHSARAQPKVLERLALSLSLSLALARAQPSSKP